MTLNTTGPISLGGSITGQSIAVELGQSPTGIITLNDTNVRSLAQVPAGTIIMPTNFYGKSNFVYDFTGTLQTGPVIPSVAPGSVYLGNSSISYDGNTLVIGAGSESNNTGAVWTYVRSGTTWAQSGAKMTGAAFSAFGYSTALSSDASRLAITMAGPTSSGSVNVYTRSGTSWALEQQIVPTGGIGNLSFGSVSRMSKDGSVLAVSGYRDNNNVGAVWVFRRTGTTWAQEAKLVGTGYALNPKQGTCLDMSENGDTLVIGAPDMYNSAGTQQPGWFWIFKYNGSSWSQQAVAQPIQSASLSDGVGRDVAISPDGTRIAVGAYGYNSSEGTVYIYQFETGSWTQKYRIPATNTIGIYPNFGQTLSFGNSGNSLAISAPGDNFVPNGNYTGAVFYYTSGNSSGTSWTQQYKMIGPGYTPNTYVREGTFVTLAKQNGTLVFATPYTPYGGYANVGQFWIYV